MVEPYLLVTGFGPFESVQDNPSGALARRVSAGNARGLELPTAFRAAQETIETVLNEDAGRVRAILSLGVHRGPGFRLERFAGAKPVSERLDVWGEAYPTERRYRGETPFDLDGCLRACQAATGELVYLSEDAGGYVCDFVYGQILRLGERFSIPSLFLHVPPSDQVSVGLQEPVVAALIAELWRQIPTIG